MQRFEKTAFVPLDEEEREPRIQLEVQLTAWWREKCGGRTSPPQPHGFLIGSLTGKFRARGASCRLVLARQGALE